MAQQTINVGTAPNDGTGDTLKTSFTKCNANFTELYGASSNYVVKTGDFMTGDLNITPFTGSAAISLRKSSGTGGYSNNIDGRTGNNLRWQISLGDSTNESGSNAGSDFTITRYTDAGGSISQPLAISRTSGVVQIGSAGIIGPTPTAGDSSTKLATTAFVAAATAAAKVGFSVKVNATQTITTETLTKVVFGATVYNDSTLYSTANNRWTPPAGRCQLTASVYFFSGLLMGTPIQIYVCKNGATFRLANNTSASAAGGASISIFDSCNGTDYYEIFIYVYAGASGGTIPSTDSATYFSGSML